MTITHAEFRKACAVATMHGLEVGLLALGINVDPSELSPADTGREMARLLREAEQEGPPKQA